MLYKILNKKAVIEVAAERSPDVPVEGSKFKSAMRRLFLGTSTTHYSTASDYKVKLFRFPASTYWVMVYTGIAFALGDLYNLFDMAKEFSKVQKSGDNQYDWSFFSVLEVLMVQTLLIGLFFKLPAFLIPFRIFCAFLRALLLSCSVVFATAFINVAVILLTFPEKCDNFSKKYFLFGLINATFLTALSVGGYCIVGVIAEAATKCTAQMKAEKKKEAALPIDA